MTRRGDALFEVMDATLCAQGPVRSAVELSMEPEFRRGHGSVYDALAHGTIDTRRLQRLLVGAIAAPRPGEPLMFAVDTTPLPRPDAEYADERVMVQAGSGYPHRVVGTRARCSRRTAARKVHGLGTELAGRQRRPRIRSERPAVTGVS